MAEAHRGVIDHLSEPASPGFLFRRPPAPERLRVYFGFPTDNLSVHIDLMDGALMKTLPVTEFTLSVTDHLSSLRYFACLDDSPQESEP